MVASVVLLGHGAIGQHVVELFTPDIQAGLVRLTAVVRDPSKHTHAKAPVVSSTDPAALSKVIQDADVVVECAGVDAAKSLCPPVVEAKKPLVLTSVGALADPDTLQALTKRAELLWVTHGAIGGFDILGAAADAGGLDQVQIRTSKAPSGLIQPWMDDAQRTQLKNLTPDDDPVVLFSGSPREAIQSFPGNVNVSVALAWATRGRALSSTEAELMEAALDRTRIELVADPQKTNSAHQITASGSAGRFSLEFVSTPSPINPKTSGQTALSVAHTTRLALASRR